MSVLLYRASILRFPTFFNLMRSSGSDLESSQYPRSSTSETSLSALFAVMPRVGGTSGSFCKPAENNNSKKITQVASNYRYIYSKDVECKIITVNKDDTHSYKRECYILY